jgi:hypothetical protein
VEGKLTREEAHEKGKAKQMELFTSRQARKSITQDSGHDEELGQHTAQSPKPVKASRREGHRSKHTKPELVRYLVRG